MQPDPKVDAKKLEDDGAMLSTTPPSCSNPPVAVDPLSTDAYIHRRALAASGSEASAQLPLKRTRDSDDECHIRQATKWRTLEAESMDEDQAQDEDSSGQLTWSQLAAARSFAAENRDTQLSDSEISDSDMQFNINTTESPRVLGQGVGVVPSSKWRPPVAP